MRTLELWVAAYLLNALWQVPLVTVAGVLAVRLLRHSSPAAEHLAWAAALACAATLPACDLSFPGLLHAFGADKTIGTIAGTQVGIALSGISASAHGLSPSLLATVAAVYGCYLLGMALRLAWSCLQIAAVQRRARPVTLTGEPAQAWARCCRFFGIHTACLAIAPDFSGPVLVGFRSRTLLLPPGFLDVAPAELETALAHEFAHMRRRDYGWNVAYTLLALSVSWHPAVWLLLARLAESREMACDRLAAQALGPAQGSKQSDRYARSLLRLASVLSDPPQAVHSHAIGIFDANTLERRIMRLTEISTRMTGARKLALASACTVLALATVVSALALRLHVGNPAPPAAAAAQPQDVMPKVIFAVDPDFPAGATAEKHPVSGVCILGVTVSEDGTPQDVHVVKSLRADFDRKAVESVSQYRFTPALRDGEPIAKDIQIEVNFQLF